MTKPIQKIKNLWEDKTGVSPIIAVILMVAITVVLAATIYVWVSGFGGGEGESISMSISQTEIIGTSGTNATFRVNSVSQGTTWDDIQWQTTTHDTFADFGVDSQVNGATGAATSLISAGDTFTISGATNINQGDTLTIKDVTSNSIVLTKVVN
ncbi:MAG: archaellin/type IV pilin N-terminal domain-containing protein [Thermoplasmatota archaeon]